MKLATTALLTSLLLTACTQTQKSDVTPSQNPADAATPSAEPVLERPTLRSLGAYWIIKGDQNKNAVVTLQYRHAGNPFWTDGPDLFRVAKGAHTKGGPGERHEESHIKLDPDASLFAGSALLLNPDTEYELKLTLIDPDNNAKTTKTLKQRTKAEPVAPKNMTTYHVVPGDGGGDGSQGNPFKGLKAADAAAKPNTLFLVHAGTYEPILLTKSGEPGKPIIYRGVDSPLLLRGNPGPSHVVATISGKGEAETKRALDLTEQHDVWLENLTVQNAHNGIVLVDSARIVVRRSKITGCVYGINAASNEKDGVKDIWISDNIILGPSVWPRAKGIEEARGIQISGAGHDVCYNYVKGFADAIDTYQGQRCEAIDFYNNECELLTDDGIEMDYSERNTRCFENRITNAFQGISVQPVLGGPVYIFRNTVYNIEIEPFKIHNSPSGVLIYHNTLVKTGIPSLAMTPAGMYNFRVKNNLFVGTDGQYANQMDLGKIEETDWDYNGYAGGPWKTFLRWQSPKDRTKQQEGHDFQTIEDVRKSGPAEKHAIILGETVPFQSGITAPADPKVEQKIQDLRLKKSSKAIDAGTTLKGFHQGLKGKPDLGAHELGQPLPHYGPRPIK